MSGAPTVSGLPAAVSELGRPRLHLRSTDSTNTRAQALAIAGAPHGTLVTAEEQSAGRGRQGRVWTAPPGRALLCSVVVRDPPRLLPLAAGLAVAEVAGRKVAGILVEGRPQERWAVVGIGLNVAVHVEDFPSELRDRATTLGLGPEAVEPTLERLLGALARWLAAGSPEVLAAIRGRDALRGHQVRWAQGTGRADGIDEQGRLRVVTDDGETALAAGEVHLEPAPQGLG